MPEGMTNDLLIIAFFVALVSSWVASRVVHWPRGILLAVIRVSVPLAYFAWFSNGTWMHQDDYGYMEQGLIALSAHHHPLLMPFDGGYDVLVSESGGFHILYGWWNMLSFWLFSDHYYAPVFMNVGLTFVGGYFLSKILALSGFTEAYRRWFYMFYLIHWDIITWSSFTNLKEVLVQTLTLLSLWLFLYLIKQQGLKKILLIIIWIASLTVFFWLRFYVPLFILLAVGIWMLYERYLIMLIFVLPVAALGLIILYPFISDYIQYLDFTFLIYGPVRTFLTPQPWNIQEEYGYLAIASIIHWVLAIPTLIGAFVLWKRYPSLRLLLIYSVTILALYSFFPAQQGPRHRVQVSPILALAQFFFLTTLWAPKLLRFAHRPYTRVSRSEPQI